MRVDDPASLHDPALRSRGSGLGEAPVTLHGGYTCSVLTHTNTSTARMIRHARVLAEVSLSEIATMHAEVPLGGRSAWAKFTLYLYLSGFQTKYTAQVRATAAADAPVICPVGQRPTRNRDGLRGTPSGTRSPLWVWVLGYCHVHLQTQQDKHSHTELTGHLLTVNVVTTGHHHQAHNSGYTKRHDGCIQIDIYERKFRQMSKLLEIHISLAFRRLRVTLALLQVTPKVVTTLLGAKADCQRSVAKRTQRFSDLDQSNTRHFSKI